MNKPLEAAVSMFFIGCGIWVVVSVMMGGSHLFESTCISSGLLISVGLVLQGIFNANRQPEGLHESEEPPRQRQRAEENGRRPNDGAQRRTSQPKTWWEVLGVSATATVRDIKAAWKAMANTTHPDKPGGNAAAFREAKEAYEAAKAARCFK
jgi:preprotein translocase subunit Sec63